MPSVNGIVTRHLPSAPHYSAVSHRLQRYEQAAEVLQRHMNPKAVLQRKT